MKRHFHRRHELEQVKQKTKPKITTKKMNCNANFNVTQSAFMKAEWFNVK